jgi:GntP family gluconate:H+ symporter
VSGFFLSIPVFFDTVFFLLIPLARALGMRTGKNYLLYVMAMAGGGAITHSMVPPTPGPLLVADALRLDLGFAIVAGLISGILPAIGVLYLAKWLDRVMPVPLRETPGATLAELSDITSRRDDELPPFRLAVLPVVLPALLIAAASFLDMAGKKLPGVVAAFGGVESFAMFNSVVQFLGNKTFALLLGALIAMALHLKQCRLTFAALGQKIGPAFETAGVIILITSAGGAFGAMIRHSGVGETIKELAEGRSVNYVLLAWLVTAVVRVAQGSATVAMITGSALMFAIVGDGASLPYHMVYIYMAVGFGSIILSWMNDSGFWVVAKLSGFTEQETLKSWTVVLTAISVIGLIETLILSSVLPLK